MALSNEDRERLERLGYDPDKFIRGDEVKQWAKKRIKQWEQEEKAKGGKDDTVSSVSKKKRV